MCPPRYLVDDIAPSYIVVPSFSPPAAMLSPTSSSSLSLLSSSSPSTAQLQRGGADEQLPLTSLSSLTQASCLSKMRHHRDIFPTNTMAYDTIVRQSRATMKERNRAQAAEKASAKRKITMSIQVKYLEKRGRSVWPKGPHLVRIFKMKSHLIQ